VKPGLDLLAAFGLALGAHAVLGLVLAGPDGRAGAEGAQTRAAAALAPAEAAALVADWNAPPVAEAAAPALPVPDASAEPAPARPVVATALAPPRLPASTLPPAPPSAAPPATAPEGLSPPRAALAESVAAPAPPRALERQQHVANTFRSPVRAPETGRLEAPRADTPPLADMPPERLAAELPAETTARPRPRPERRAASASADAAPKPAGAAQTARAARAASPAPGTGGQGADADDSRRLKAAWAGAIGARIARAQRHPGAGHGTGRVRVTLVVARDGRLAEVRVASSSGSAGLDRAAVAAVRRAAPFPEAPGALTDDWMRFGHWVAFR